ncbi:MAG TPA: transketolase, partial [Spirochaetia bacterium]|nr:transketolase [Spirochaetia bacterium]
FSDYMKPAIRLAAIMRLPVMFIFTHDSLYVGEDGPTHQPVEQFAGLRAVPQLEVWRPGDAQENAAVLARILARTDGPSVLALTRQKIPVYAKHDSAWRESIARGAYVVKESKGRPKLVIVATGSEVSLALETVRVLKRDDIRIVSMPCRERFLAGTPAQREELLPNGVRRVVIEAGVAMGWESVAGPDGLLICMNDFGISGPSERVAEHFGFHPDAIARKIRALA